MESFYYYVLQTLFLDKFTNSIRYSKSSRTGKMEQQLYKKSPIQSAFLKHI